MLRSAHLGFATLVASFCFASACGTDLGPCDMNAATSIVYKRGPDGLACATRGGDGLCVSSSADQATFYMPYVEGQAIAHASCGAGGICHAESATGALRNGAPAGLNFDLAMGGADTMRHVGVLTKPEGHATLLDWLEESWAAIKSGEMPPGAAGEAAQSRGRWFKNTALNSGAFVKQDYALPTLDTAQGKETIRNWLACGAPVVNGNVALGEVVPAEVIPPAWDQIHELVIADSCLACHGQAPSIVMNANLVLSDACSAYRALVNHPVSPGSTCAQFPGALVVPGNPGASLLMHKLDRPIDDDVFPVTSQDPTKCGYPMPLFETQQLPQSTRDSIRAWITNGALPPPNCAP